MISETYNSIADLYKGIAKKTQNLIDKLNNGQKITKRETKELEELKKQAADKMNKSADYFLKSLGNEGAQPILDLIKSANESCVCDLETEEVKKGPVFDDIFVNLEDCKKCLEEQKKKQEQASLLAKAFEKRYKSMKNKEMTCGCLSWGNFLQDISIIDGLTDCEEIVSIMNKAKSDLSKIGSADFSVNNLFFDENKPTGQVSIGNTCIDNFSLKANPNSASIVVNRDKKTQYNDPAVEISNNNITITDYSNPGSSLVIGTDDNEQAKLVEKWLFEEKSEIKTNFAETLTPELLKKIFPLVDKEDSKKILPFLNKYLIEFGINTCEERIHFFAQIAEETTQLKDLSELPSDYASSKSQYKGRGLMQLTGWKYNYKPFEAYCKNLGDDVDFKDHPEEVATNPKYAVLSAFWYWKIEKKCSQYCNNLSEENLLKISKLVNCGNIKFCGYKKNSITGKNEKCYECKPNGWSKRKKEFERLKELIVCNQK
ncbi:MAG: hypothetical protein Q8K92_12840 [Leadbetterella sp.]|nr:hypothetical protein [Leadbetterella sp.]